MTDSPAKLSLKSRFYVLKSALVGFAASFALSMGFKALLPPSEPSYSYSAIAASFLLNLGGLAWALACLPSETSVSRRTIFTHFKAWFHCAVPIACAFVALWLAPIHHESLRVFLALAVLSIVQAGATLAVHALLSIFFGANNRIPKILCTLLICVLATALFWSREPIERLAKTSGEGAQQSSQLADGVMKFSPPMTVASAWYQESDGARTPQSTSSHRFDLVHGPLTYVVWIGSYQAVGCPDILPSGGTGDFYIHREFSPGIALILLLWALPILIVADLLLWRTRLNPVSPQTDTNPA